MLDAGGWLYRDAHYFAVDLEVDAAKARAWVPPPLRLATPDVATLFTAYFPSNTFGSVYHEAGLFLPVVHRFTRAIHCPWMVVDDDVALILGRELLGYPKKLGVIELSIDGDRIRGVASRRGVELIRMTGTLHERIDDPPPFLGRPHRNVRSVLGVALPKIVAFTPREVPIEVRRAEVEIQIAGSERDPLSDLGFGRVLGARLHRVNLAAGGVPLPCAGVSPLAFLDHALLRTW
jgi:acetoacetate decarboxylase